MRLDELAEDQDPGAFPSEGARRRGIVLDRWSGRHRVLVTVLTGVLAAAAAYFAWRRTGNGSIGWLVGDELLIVTAFTTGCWRVCTKARERYRRR
ncbi:hypothetical protein AB0J55_25940 [Amycolatopsis sp. NPDC049688]|uniref:hypothetical protein n=1 Tax=Amycolatopsis sp. NPDC049688 TaxID=3154733 RepID=UPI0034178DBB